jgi:predicted AlkP superfamily phosphohydrolase/phosphomutase
VNNRTIIISLDGLSLSDFACLIKKLPQASKLIDATSLCSLEAGLLTSPQAIWAELLTGQPWYLNGCYAHARPFNNLNSTRIITESDFLCCVRLFDLERPHIIVNAPLLVPRKPQRVWMADGSLPVPTTVSPASVIERDSFCKYKPRPYFSPLNALGNSSKIMECFDCERARLEYATDLLKNEPWSFSLIRLTLFDQLSHLLGVGYLQDSDLVYAEPLNDFLKLLDAWLAKLLRQNCQTLIMSAFSHVSCISRLSLNNLLYEGNFLDFKTSDEAMSRRLVGLSVLGNEGEDIDSEQAKEAFLYQRSNCQQSMFDESTTIAASPMSGCIFINAVDRFSGGIVPAAEIEFVHDDLKNYLCAKFESRFGSHFSIWSRMQVAASSPDAPDFLVYIPGVELHNSADKFLRPFDKPRSVHYPQGFVCSSSNQPSGAMAAQELWKIVGENEGVHAHA